MGLLQAILNGTPVHFDHLAFRTFGVPGLGIDSIASVFMDFGYKQQPDELSFAEKKLRARWFAPPNYETNLPRLFVSELQVELLSQEAQDIIRHYTAQAGPVAGRQAALCAATGVLPWNHASVEHFERLASESEYAAWVLCNGYNLNHTTVAVHKLERMSGGIDELVQQLDKRGIHMSDAGGIVKISPDGRLLQSSTVSDRIPFTFERGDEHNIPGAYLEFAERRVLPEFSHLEPRDILEKHRRDGFEAANANHIFDSTKAAWNSREEQPLAGYGQTEETML
eukprot:jgi/Astpho2/8383/e_gw1.00122.110.1_t